jgi:hypothetical protein
MRLLELTISSEVANVTPVLVQGIQPTLIVPSILDLVDWAGSSTFSVCFNNAILDPFGGVPAFCTRSKLRTG